MEWNPRQQVHHETLRYKKKVPMSVYSICRMATHWNHGTLEEADSQILCDSCGKMSLRFFESIDLCTDFERRAQFHVHSVHEVVLCKQQQGLSVDLLWLELCSDIMASLEQVEETQRWIYDSKDNIKICYISCPL